MQHPSPRAYDWPARGHKGTPARQLRTQTWYAAMAWRGGQTIEKGGFLPYMESAPQPRAHAARRSPRYFPVNFAGRFSRKARTPSLLSAVSKSWFCSWRS